MLRLSVPNVGEACVDAVARVLRSGQLVHGAESEAFEAELAAYLGCRDVVLVSSGTAALHLALHALGIGAGDAVLVPDFTFPATANVVRLVGARPVVVDVDPTSYCIDPEKLAAAVAAWSGPERLRAVMPVHEFGQPAAMDAVNSIAAAHGLYVIEDAACALGATSNRAKVGTLGDVGCFSFHPRKTLTTGEGGALATSDPDLAARLRRLRNHGMTRDSRGLQFAECGYNYRLTNFQAAMGRMQLPQLDDWVGRRRNLAAAYRTALGPLSEADLITVPAACEGHSWQTFMVVLADGVDRDAVIVRMREDGVECNLGAQSLSALGLYDAGGIRECGARLYRQGLALPFCEQYGASELAQAVAALERAVAG